MQTLVKFARNFELSNMIHECFFSTSGFLNFALARILFRLTVLNVYCYFPFRNITVSVDGQELSQVTNLYRYSSFRFYNVSGPRYKSTFYGFKSPIVWHFRKRSSKLYRKILALL